MILEGIVTTLSPEGTINIAPMGPIVNADWSRLILRPYKTSDTYRNLSDHPEGVFHVTDDVLLLAKAAVGRLDPQPSLQRATAILGYYLPESCRHYEFRVVARDERQDRVTLEAEVVHQGWQRDFFGFNRAKNAVLEAAILATRTAFLPLEEIAREFDKFQVIVDKTGGPAEMDALAVLKDFLNEEIQRRPS